MSRIQEQEKLFSPSKWSKRLSADVICTAHVTLTRNYSQETEEIIPCKLNCRYGDRQREIYDIFGTDLEDGSPVLIFLHGGYWQEKSIAHNNYSFISRILYKKKIKSLFVGYELCPDVQFEEIPRNIETAISHCLQYAKETNARSIHLVGHSAGAQLIANLFESYITSLPLCDQKLFKSAFLLAGIYDLLPLLETSNNFLLNLDRNKALKASTQYKCISGKVTFFVVTAEYDSPAFIEQGMKLHKHFESLGLTTRYVMIKNVDHFDLIEMLIDETYELTELIVRTILH